MPIPDEILEALKTGDRDKIRDLVQKEKMEDFVDDSGKTLFQYALENDKDGQIINLLSDFGWNPYSAVFYYIYPYKSDSFLAYLYPPKHGSFVLGQIKKINGVEIKTPEKLFKIKELYTYDDAEFVFESAVNRKDYDTLSTLLDLGIIHSKYRSKNDGVTLLKELVNNGQFDLANKLFRLFDDSLLFVQVNILIETELKQHNWNAVRFFVGQSKISPFMGVLGSLLEMVIKYSDHSKEAYEILQLLEKLASEKEQNPRDMTFYDQVYVKYMRKKLSIQTAGHLLGLSTEINITHPSGKIVGMSTEGGSSYQGAIRIFSLLRDYVEIQELKFSSQTAKRFNKIQKAFDVYKKYLHQDGSVTEDTLADKYRQGDLIVLPVSTPQHHMTLSFSGDKIILCNRGEGMLETGITIFNIKDKNMLDANFVTKVTEKFETIEDLLSFLAKNGIDTSKGVSLPSGEQGHGTCTFVNVKSALMGILYTLAVEDGLSNDDALNFAITEYKKFTQYMRDDYLHVLIRKSQSEFQKDVDKEEAEIPIKLLAQYALEHHGETRASKIGTSRPEKKKQDIERVKKILASLKEEDQKRLFAEILKNKDLKVITFVAKFDPNHKIAGDFIKAWDAKTFWEVYTDALLANNSTALNYFGSNLPPLIQHFKDIPAEKLQIIKTVFAINLREGPDRNEKVIKQMSDLLTKEQQLELCKLLKADKIDVVDEDLLTEKPLLEIIRRYQHDTHFDLTPHPVLTAFHAAKNQNQPERKVEEEQRSAQAPKL